MYPYHAPLAAPARPTNQIWRLLAGLFMIAVIFMVLGLGLSVIAQAILPETVYVNYIDKAADGSTPVGAMTILYTFALLGSATLIVARSIHKRGFTSLTGPLDALWRDFWATFKWLALVTFLVIMLPSGPGPGGELEQNLPFGTWLMLLPFGLLGLLFQTGSEEMLFRGYIQQQLAARFNHPVVWMGLPAIVFGIGHYSAASAGDNAWIIALWATIFGLGMADLTARAGNLGPALAVHMFNNFTAILLTAPQGNLSGLALYTLPFDMQDAAEVRTWLPVDFMMMVVSWLAARVAIRR